MKWSLRKARDKASWATYKPDHANNHKKQDSNQVTADRTFILQKSWRFGLRLDGNQFDWP